MRRSPLLVAAIVFSATLPIRADLLVSNYGDGNVRKYNDSTGAPIPPTPSPNPPPPFLQGGGGGEGVACLTLGDQALYFVANNTQKVGVFDQNTGAPVRTIDLGAGASVAALSLSLDGLFLYAADAGLGRIAIIDPTTGVFTSVPTPNGVHDVVVGPDGSVYAANYNSNSGVVKFTRNGSTLSSAGQFIAANDHGLDKPGGMVFDATGKFFFVSRLQPFVASTPSFVNEYAISNSGTATWVQTFQLPGAGPLGLALGPDGNIYTANFNDGTIGKINLTNNVVSTFIPSPTAGPRPKYLFFSGIACKTGADAFIEVCKSSSITNPVTGTYTFTATNGAFSTSPVAIPVGVCSGPLPVPSGTVTVSEAPTAGTGVSAVVSYGFNALSIIENRLVSSNLANRTATVSVPPGKIANETLVDFTNFNVPTGVLEICKDVSPAGSSAGSFSFNVSGALNNPYTIPGGACSGPILVQAGSVTITESPRAGFSLIDVTTIPADRLSSINIPSETAVVNVVAGDVSAETVVRFLNAPSSPGQLKICKVAGPGVLVGQSFIISAGGSNYTIPAGPAASGGYCVTDGSFPVGTVVTVQETPPFPYQVLNLAANPPSRASAAPVYAGGNGQMNVTIGPGFTEVTVTNIGSAPAGQLKICKVGGTGVAIGTNFTFSVSNPAVPGTVQTYTVPAGPSQSGGYCIADGTFPIGTKLTVTEIPSPGYTLSGIMLNGTPLSNGTPSANIVIGNGISEVTFTNTPSAVPTAGTATQPLLNIVNYEVVSRRTTADGMLSTTYRADLLNTGTYLESATATLTSLDRSSVQVLPGEDILMFSPVPANSQITSKDTFTIVTTLDAKIDFTKLKWTLEAKRPPRRRAAAH